MDNETRELLASITGRLEMLSARMHDDARESATLKSAATKLRTGVRPAVVLAELDSDIRWHHVGA